MEFVYLEDVPEVGGDGREDDLVRIHLVPVGAGEGDVGEVVPGVEVLERGGHVRGEVVPLQAVLLGRRAAHCEANGLLLLPKIRLLLVHRSGVGRR